MKWLTVFKFVLPVLMLAFFLWLQSESRQADEAWADFSKAVARGDTVRVRRMVTQDRHLYGWQTNGMALYLAQKHGKRAIMKMLLELGADPNRPYRGGVSATFPAHFAASEGDAQMFALLLEHGATPNWDTVLLAAVYGRNGNIVATALRQGASLNGVDEGGRTPLHRVAITGDADICRQLLEAGADVYAVDRYGDTPHAVALREQNFAVAGLLAEAQQAGTTAPGHP